jgi:hypothetical protein
MLDKEDSDTFYCDECHTYFNIERLYLDQQRQLCVTCYYGDNVGTACTPGECTYPGCKNNKETGDGS